MAAVRILVDDRENGPRTRPLKPRLTVLVVKTANSEFFNTIDPLLSFTRPEVQRRVTDAESAGRSHRL